MDVLHDMHLTLVFRQRESSRPVSHAPFPRVVRDRETDELDERRSRPALRFVFFVRPRGRPHAGEIDLSSGRDAACEGGDQAKWKNRSG
jgi:hypothetical protein